jgi:hypothetical protein
MPPVPNEGDATAHGAVNAIADLLKLIVATVAIVYVAGGAVLWVRLTNDGVPTDPVVSALPREFLIAVGLKSIVAPALLFAAIGGVFIGLRAHLRNRRDRDAIVGLALFLVFAAFGFLIPSFVIGRESWALALLAGFVVTVAIALALSPIIVKERTTLAVARERTTMAVMLVIVATGIGGAVARILVEAFDHRSSKATVCVKDAKGTFQGDYIGETDKTIYLADSSKDAVLSIPKGRVAESLVARGGQRPEFPTCRMTYPLPQPPAAANP